MGCSICHDCFEHLCSDCQDELAKKNAEHAKIKTVKEIVLAHLVAIGADGLCNENCGCGNDDLMPCDQVLTDCEPAKKYVDTFEGEIFIPLRVVK